MTDSLPSELCSLLLQPAERRKKPKAFCRIKRKDVHVGWGCLVDDAPGRGSNLIKYFIITSSKAVPKENFDAKEYEIEFEKRPSVKRCHLTLIAKTVYYFLSGLVLIAISPDCSEFNHSHWKWHRRCSVLKKIPKVASQESPFLFFFIGNTPYDLGEVVNSEDSHKGCSVLFQLSNGDSKVQVVGIVNLEENGQSSTIMLPQSSLNTMLAEENYIVIQVEIKGDSDDGKDDSHGTKNEQHSVNEEQTDDATTSSDYKGRTEPGKPRVDNHLHLQFTVEDPAMDENGHLIKEQADGPKTFKDDEGQTQRKEFFTSDTKEIQGTVVKKHEMVIKVIPKCTSDKLKEKFSELLSQDIKLYSENNTTRFLEGLGDFLKFLLDSHDLCLRKLGIGCLEITVQCPTLDKLERLWNDSLSGRLDEIAERYLTTTKVKAKLGVETLRFKAYVKEESYLACKESFMIQSHTCQDGPQILNGASLGRGASEAAYLSPEAPFGNTVVTTAPAPPPTPGTSTTMVTTTTTTSVTVAPALAPDPAADILVPVTPASIPAAVPCRTATTVPTTAMEAAVPALASVSATAITATVTAAPIPTPVSAVATSSTTVTAPTTLTVTAASDLVAVMTATVVGTTAITGASTSTTITTDTVAITSASIPATIVTSMAPGIEIAPQIEEQENIDTGDLTQGGKPSQEEAGIKNDNFPGPRLPSIETILRSNTEFVEQFSLCLDREMRGIQNWRHLASKLEVDATVIRRLEQYPDFSPTIRLFEYLELKQPDLTMRHLKEAFSEIKRNDLLGFLTTGASFDDSEKVKDVIRGGLLDGIALALDGSSLALSNWKTLALSFSVPRKAIRELERQSMESPSGKMFQYLATSAPGMKISSLKKALESLDRMDLFNFLQNQNQGDDVFIKNVIVPGSDLHEKMTQELNYEGPCIKNWKHVASKLKIPPDVYQNFDEFKQTRLSPTKEILEWVATRFPEKRISDVAKALEEIQRNDVIQIISKHYPNAVVVELREESVYHGRLSDRTVLVGRGDICEDIVHALSLKKAVEIVAPPGYGKTEVVTEVAHRMLEGGKFVAYVKPRGFNCVEDLASKIIEAFGFFPGKKPISEVFHCISSMKNKNGLLIIENIDNLLHLEDQVRNDDYQKELKSKTYFTETCGKYSKNDFITFLKDIGQKLNVQLILTSRETYDLNVYFPTELVYLEPLNEDDSASMFAKCDDSLGDDVIGDLVRASRGIPRLICTLISALKRENPQKLARRLATSSAKALIKELNPVFLADEDRIDKCLEICFQRLGEENQNILVMSSTFPYRFTHEQFEKVFGSSVAVDLQTCLNCLIQRSFLRYDKINCQYFLDRFFRDFFSLKPDHVEAKSTFIRYYSDLAVTLCETFLTKDCKSAIKQYRSERDNIREAMAWCGDDHPELDQSVRQQYITAFNKAAVFLAKMMRKQEFQSLFCKLAYLCRSDLHLHSACLTNIGMKIVLSCTCTPHICPRALSQAKETLTDANDIYSTLTNVKDSIRAQCLSKLGFCCVREGRIGEGYGYLDNALKLRKRRTEESKKCKDHVMLAACYNDLAASQMVQRNHMLAIHTRMENVLPVYEEKLGVHPFTATTLNWIGNSYHALGKYDHAIAYNSRSFTIRKQLLGEHQETARSLHDLGVAYSAKKEYEIALKYLEEAVKLQEKVLDTQDELIHTHQAMSIALRGLGRTKEAEEEMNRAVESAKKVDSLRAPLKKLKIQERGEWVEYSQ